MVDARPLPFVYEAWDGANPPDYVDPFPAGTRLRLRRDGGEVTGTVQQATVDGVLLHTGIVVVLPGWTVVEASPPRVLCGAWDPHSRVQCTRNAGHRGRRHWHDPGDDDHEDDDDMVTWLVNDAERGEPT